MYSMKGLSINKFLPGIAWFFIVLVLTCLPGDDLPKVNNWFNEYYIDKLVHAGIFLLLAYLFMYPVAKTGISNSQKRNYFIKIALACTIWGITIELIQKYFIPGRSFDWFDWISDGLGAFTALWVGMKQFLK